MKKSRVIIVPCDSYDQGKTDAAVRAGMESLERDGKLLSADEKILLKPNLLTAAVQEKAVTTHPAVFRALVKYLRETGRSRLSYGDSPSNGTMRHASDVSGIAQTAAQLGIPEAEFEHAVKTAYPAGHTAKEFMLAQGILDADAVVNVGKLKTHALERITGAVKISYGYVQGRNKAMGHAHFPNADRFADMLVDLNQCVKPRFSVMDGIVSMEGNGDRKSVV